MRRMLALLLAMVLVFSLLPAMVTTNAAAEPYFVEDPADDGRLYILAGAASQTHFFMDELNGLIQAAGIKATVANLYKASTTIELVHKKMQNKESDYNLYVYNENGKVTHSNVDLDYALKLHNWDYLNISEGTSVHRTMTPDQVYQINLIPHQEIFAHIRESLPNVQIHYQQSLTPDIGFDRGGFVMDSVEKQKDWTARVKLYTNMVCQEFNVKRIPVADAYTIAREEYAIAQLCKDDYYHDGDQGGSYLSACVWFEVFTGQSCIGNTFRPTYELSEEMIATLQQCAHKAVEEMRANGDQIEWPEHTHNSVTFEPWNETDSLPTSGNYFLTDDVTLAETLEIPADSTLNLDLRGWNIKSGEGTRIFTVNGTLNIYDCKDVGRITGATVENGAIVVSGQVNMYGGRISGNGNTSAAQNGGAVYLNAGSVFNMYAGQLYDNHATTNGGAVYVDGGKLNVYGGMIWNNSTTGTGKAAIGGGAIYGKNGAQVELYNATFTENSGLTGGAIRLEAGSTLVAENCTFTKNDAYDNSASGQVNGGSGGAIALAGTVALPTTAEVKNCTFTENTAGQKKLSSSWSVLGGAFFQKECVSSLIEKCSFTGNTSGARGGAIAVRTDGGSLTIKDSSITGNHCDDLAGAIFIGNNHPVRLENTTVTGNTTGGDKGAVYLGSVASRVIVSGKTVISGNTNSASDGNNQQDLSYISGSSETSLLEVDELTAGAHINLYFYHKDSSVSKSDTAADYVKVMPDGSQSDWDCGWVTVYKSADDLGRTVSKTDEGFVFGHIHKMPDGSYQAFEPYADTIAPTKSGYYYLEKDITTTKRWVLTKDNFHLCFNGKILTAGEGTGIAVKVGDGSGAGITVNFYDCTAAITADGTYSGGGITGTNVNFGSGVYVDRATVQGNVVNWYNGGLLNCVSAATSTDGGAGGAAIYLRAKNSTSPFCGTLNWYNGAVINCHTEVQSDRTDGSATGVMQASSGCSITIYNGLFKGNYSVNNRASGPAYGGLIYNAGELTIHDGDFVDNSAYHGGAIYNLSEMTINGGRFYGNTAGVQGSADAAGVLGYGGVIYTKASKILVKINGGEFYENLAYGQGGVLYHGSSNDQLEIIGTEEKPVIMRDNQALVYYAASTSNGVTTIKSAQGYAGAYDLYNGTATVKYVHFINNYALAGGAVRVGGGSGTSNGTFENCLFDGNSVKNYGGAIRLSNDNMTVTDCQIINNTATKGGAIYATSDTLGETAATLRIESTKIDGNRASSEGGAISAYGNSKGAPVFYVEDSVISGNSADAGAVIFTHANNAAQLQPELTLKNTQITGNTAVSAAGVIQSGTSDYVGAIVLIDGCTITGNSAKNAAVAHLYNDTTVTMKDTQVTGNWCVSGHGAINLNNFKNVFNVEGKTSIIGNTMGEFSLVEFNVYVRDFSSNNVSVFVAEGKSLDPSSKIGVTLQGTSKRTEAWITNEGTAKYLDNFVSDLDTHQVVALESTDRLYISQAQVGEKIYATAQKAIDAGGNLPIKLLGNVENDLTAAASFTLDLNGKAVQKLTMAEGTKVSLIDSTTNDYDCTGGYGTISVDGDYDAYFEDSSSGSLKRYVVVPELGGTVSAHRVYLAITTKVLRPTNNGVGFKAIFAGDEVVAEKQDMFGIEIATNADFNNVSTGSFTDMTAGIEGTSTPNQKTIILRDVLQAGMDNATSYNTEIYGRPYIVIGEEVVYGTTVSTNMSDLVDAALKSNDATVVEAVNAMLAEFGMSK